MTGELIHRKEFSVVGKPQKVLVNVVRDVLTSFVPHKSGRGSYRTRNDLISRTESLIGAQIPIKRVEETETSGSVPHDSLGC